MKSRWLFVAISIASLFSVRMFGLFMLIPIFTLFASQLKYATPLLTGIALGGYGLTQGLLQLPFGFLSDQYGRKPLLAIGLLFLALGSLVGALSNSVYTMILARVLQGAGAIGSVLIALLADLTPTEHRTKSMAIIGSTIGISFAVAMVISPLLTSYYGFKSIFYFSLLLSILGMILLYNLPTPPQRAMPEKKFSYFKLLFKDKKLWPLNLGIFLQHFLLTATFYALPFLLQKQVMLNHIQQPWRFYLLIMFGSFIAMIPIIFKAEKKSSAQIILKQSIFVMSVAQLVLAFFSSQWIVFCGLIFIYFVTFNILEALLPSLVSKLAQPEMRGAAMGLYSSSQFLGIFLGGISAGILYPHVGHAGIFLTNGLLGMVWLSCFASIRRIEYNQATTNYEKR